MRGAIPPGAASWSAASRRSVLQIATAGVACLLLLYTDVSTYVLMGIAAAIFAGVEFL